MIIDTHIHLSHGLYDHEFSFVSYEGGQAIIYTKSREALVQMLKSAGIEACIEPAIDIESNQRLLLLSKQYDGFIFPAVGVHPTRTFQYRTREKNGKTINARLLWNQRSQIDELAANPSVVAIGETGLDYHLPRHEQHRLRQKIWFIWQLKIAHENRLPVILHVREADDDALRILRKYQSILHGGVYHCFSGTVETAKKYNDLGLKLGIGGSLLIDSARKYQLEQVVIQMSLEQLVLETDGPFVKPNIPGLKKKQIKKSRNTSLTLPAVVNRIAELKRISPEEVERVTTDNAYQLFKLHKRGAI